VAEHVDVVIVGAGLSGIGAARRLQQDSPGRTFAILESRASIGGTWDLFRYPGVRSDSDMFTLSYPFRPWKQPKAIADGASIRGYIRETAEEGGLGAHIHYRTRVVGASWSSEQARWTVRTRTGESGTPRTYTCSFLYLCTGYYDYEQGHQPDFPGVEDFRGRLVHPQFWPEDLNYTDRRVVVIGSGATAITLVPAMTEQAAHVTMLQRSPSYVTALPASDGFADTLRRFLPAGIAHSASRMKNALLTVGFYQLCRRRPELGKRLLRKMALRFLKDPAYVDEHFTPAYEPWDQRLCIAPEGDFFRVLHAGKASIVTDHIDRFVGSGIRLASGATLDADIVVSATGLSLLAFGGMELTVDGEPVSLPDTVTYRGLMLSGVPNFAYCIGYTNASWTLRADMSSRYVCRLLNYLKRKDLASATPKPAPATGKRPLLDLTSGYVLRAIDSFPTQGDRDPWTVRQNYLLDRLTMTGADLTRDMDFVARADLPASAEPLHGTRS
jgi:cation diffusion facilitator CzcD-associated flavoprotein CzcO